MNTVQETLPADQSEVLSVDWKQQIYNAETTRVTSINPVEYRALIAQLDALQNLLAKDPTKEKLTGILSIVRLKATTQMQLASVTPNLGEHVTHLQAARKTLHENHLNSELKAQAQDVREGLRGEKIEFAIELARDVAKYLDKVAKLTGDLSFHADAAQVLTIVTEAFEKNISMSDKITAAPERESYHLAHFERLLQLDLSQIEKIDVGELFHYFKMLSDADADSEGKVQNWDRQAAIGWWLFEYGVRHNDETMKKFGMERVHKATMGDRTEDKDVIDTVKRMPRVIKKVTYIAKRMVANANEMHRKNRFAAKTPEEQETIKEQLRLHKE
jgi:hypothetical protein